MPDVPALPVFDDSWIAPLAIFWHCYILLCPRILICNSQRRQLDLQPRKTGWYGKTWNQVGYMYYLDLEYAGILEYGRPCRNESRQCVNIVHSRWMEVVDWLSGKHQQPTLVLSSVGLFNSHYFSAGARQKPQNTCQVLGLALKDIQTQTTMLLSNSRS